MADRKISDLTALTAPAAGDYLPIVDISEVAAASKNKRITIEELFRGTPDGTAAAPAIAPESDPNTGIYSSGADQLSIATNGTERLRIDSSGRLLVGTSSTASAGGSQYAKLQVKGNTFSDSGGGVISVLSGTTTPASGVSVGAVLFAGTTGNEFGRIECIADAATGASDYPGRLEFSTTADGASSPTERMRINNLGRLSLNCTALPTSGTPGVALTPAGNVHCGVDTTATADVMRFDNPNGRVGSIATTGSATAYNTSSDYRLKENVTAVTDSITRLQQLKPSRFNFIADPAKTVDGFIAHEAAQVVPECVTGEKDAVDADGNPVYQGIDQSKLVPLLTAALQEAVAKIESLEARLTAAGI